MLDIIKDLAFYVMAAGLLLIVAYLLKSNKQNMINTILQLIQQAEETIQGSGLGAEKKAAVIEQLQILYKNVPPWVSDKIDELVAILNAKQAFFSEKAKEVTKTL